MKKNGKIRKAINEGKLPFQDIYELPQDESIAKMVSVAFYFAFVDMESFKRRFGTDFKERFADEVKFVLENELMEERGTRLYLTQRGSDYINGVIPLFYSDKSKLELQTAFSGKSFGEKSDEELFLSAYDIEKFDRPSVTTDIAAFTISTHKEDCYRKNPVHKLSLLLIRCGEHPYMNSWALPGGFVRADETLEQCAYREIREETNLEPVSLMPVAVFSNPDRDPRGRINSNAFASVLSENSAKVMSGDDAIDAKWFEVSFESHNGEYRLSLVNGSINLIAVLAEEKNSFGRMFFRTVENNGLAFDHAEIIATALFALKSNAGNIENVFDFLPEKFTLAALQKVQETLLGTSLLTANFRRKIADYVQETDEYTEGAGHRPARLFKRKIINKNKTKRSVNYEKNIDCSRYAERFYRHGTWHEGSGCNCAEG